MNTKPLHIPKDKINQSFGLKIDCAECGTLVNAICRKSGLVLEQCKFGHRQSFKVIAYESQTGKRRTKNLQTKDYKEAVLEAALFQKQIKKEKRQVEKIHYSPVESIPQSAPLLVDSLAKCVAFLRGSENIPEHKRRTRCPQHCKQVENTLLEFVKCLKDNYKVKELTVVQVNQDMIGKYHADIVSRKMSPRSYNLRIGTLRTFYNYLMREGQVRVNPFAGIIRKPETHTISILTKEEYEALLEAIQKPEIGKRRVGKEVKDFYRPWIKPAIQIALATGRRGEEVIRSKWDNIQTDVNGDMLSLSVIDYKVSRQQNRLEDNPKRISVPITAELKELLLGLGAKEKIGSPEYIIGTDETMDRKTMKVFLTRSFSHYWNQLEYSKTKKISFKVLRKTYLSSLSAAIGISNARVISQHSDTKILADHYVSDQVIGVTAKNFSVFSQQEERQEELNKLRQSGNHLSLEK
jgi:integrase